MLKKLALILTLLCLSRAQAETLEEFLESIHFESTGEFVSSAATSKTINPPPMDPGETPPDIPNEDISGRESLSSATLLSTSSLTTRTLDLPSEERPDHWADRLQVPGVPNLARVSPALYRGGQPTREGFEALQQLGIKTVVSLRTYGSDRRLAVQYGLDYEHIPIALWNPEYDELVAIIRLATKEPQQPVYIYDERGTNRVGLVAAIYRVVVDDWSRQEAVREMLKGGYGMRPLWRNLEKYVRGLQVDEFRKAAGVLPPDRTTESEEDRMNL